MADKIRLALNNTYLDLSADKYTETHSAVDTINKSEAGTTLRAVVRTGIPTLSVSYKCDATEKALLDGFSRTSSLTCKRWSEGAAAETSWTCYMSNYQADLEIETSDTRFYKVSFKLNDLEN